MRIGYYAHHHGSGHCRQADKLAALLPPSYRQQMIVFTSLSAEDYTFSHIDTDHVIRLSAEDERPDDVLAGRAGQYWQPSSLHYSPVGNSDIQQRSWQILDTIQQRQIDLMIIDVSAEVAMLCRAASVPYLYVRLPGERDDTPHVSAFTGALALLAPYPKTLEAMQTPNWVVQKTYYLGFLVAKEANKTARFDFKALLMDLAADNTVSARLETEYLDDKRADDGSKHNRLSNDPLKIVTVIKGYGGHAAIDAKLPELRKLLPEALIISLGPIDDAARHCVDIATEVSDVTPFIAHSDLLVMACGLNAVAQAYDYATPLVVLPDARPHREQEVMAEALIAQGRALSWAQFTTQGRDKQSSIPSLCTDNPKLLDKTDNTTRRAAQDLISSITTYPSTKAWFDQWLLPKLNISVEV